MLLYFLKRVGLTIPTLFGISLVCFFLVHLTPGGPVEQVLYQMQEGSTGHSGVITDEQRESIRAYYGFDKPLPLRYLHWVGNLLRLEFGDSYLYEEPVWDVMKERIPISVIFGVVSFILTYTVCIPLGILKAIFHNTWFDSLSSGLVFFLYSIPGFALGIVLMVLFCGGDFFDWFPVGGFTSDEYDDLSFVGKMLDIAHHMFLPLFCYTIGSFAMLTMLMKNSLLDQIKQDYITTARAKGLREKTVVLKHALRNALLPVANGFGQWISLFFTGSLLIESIFNLNGMGLLSFEAAINRDYPVVLASIVILSFLYILGNILSDLLYLIIDPRIDFR